MSQARYVNTSNVPLALAVFLATDNYDHNPDPYTISATTLLKPLRQIILPARIPQEDAMIDLAAQMSTAIGSAIHDGIERSWRFNYAKALAALGYPAKLIARVRINPTQAELDTDPDIVPFYLEQRASKKVGQWTVTGKWDFIGEGRVQDFKSASIWSYKNQVNADKQILQGSLYRWLAPEKITQSQMDIHHIFKDWKAGMTKTDPSYPPQHFLTQTFDLLPVQETEMFVRQKLALIEQYWNAAEADIPECSDEDLWRTKAVFKWYKNGDASASRSTKNFDSMHDAQSHMSLVGKGAGVIVERPGEVKACRYCAGFAACTQKDRLIMAGDLIV